MLGAVYRQSIYTGCFNGRLLDVSCTASERLSSALLHIHCRSNILRVQRQEASTEIDQSCHIYEHACNDRVREHHPTCAKLLAVLTPAANLACIIHLNRPLSQRSKTMHAELKKNTLISVSLVNSSRTVYQLR